MSSAGPRASDPGIAAFIGVAMNLPKGIATLEKSILKCTEVRECHHVTGSHTLLLHVVARNTSALEALISKIRGFRGVERTETMVVLATRANKRAQGD